MPYRNNRSWLAKSIGPLLFLQSLALIGFFAAHSLPHVVRKLGSGLHPTVVATTEVARILVATCLVMTARGINLRRRRAWFTATFLEIVLIATSLVHPILFLLRHQVSRHAFIGDLLAAHLFTQLLLLILLIRYRNDFKTVTDPVTRKKASLFFIRNLALAFTFGLALVYFDSKSFVVTVDFKHALEITFKGLFGISSSVMYKTSQAQERLEFFLGGLGFLLLASSLAQFLKPAQRTTTLSLENSVKVRQLLATTPDSDSLSYFSLRDNKTVIWSKNNKAAIPYSIVNGVMITTGDPVGDRESWPSAINEFMNEAQRHAWIPAIYGCSEPAGEIWVRETGFIALEIGDEAIVDVNDFTIDGATMKNVRQTLNRINRLGYTTKTSFVRDLDSSLRSELGHQMQSWRKSATERGFSMALGRFCNAEDPDCVITWAENDGRIVAVLQFVPWGRDSLSLDVMRRSPDAETGVNELMIQATIAFAKAHGFKRISLNFASFRSIFERGKKLGAGPITRMNHKILVFLSRFFQMESLYRFNAKFAPLWEPRFAIFPGIRNLARVGYAILKIEAVIPKPKWSQPKI